MLKYVDNLTVRTHALSPQMNWSYQVGLTAALIDPSQPGTGPVSGIPLVPQYTRYRPLSVGIDMIFSNPEAGPVTLIIVPSYINLGAVNTIAISAMQSLMNDRNVLVFQFNGATSGDKSMRIKHTWSVERIIGLNSEEWRSDPNYTGGVAGHPTNIIYVNIMVFSNEGTNFVTGVGVMSMFKMLYELYQPLDN